MKIILDFNDVVECKPYTFIYGSLAIKVDKSLIRF